MVTGRIEPCIRPLQDYSKLKTNFSGKVFKLVDKTQFEALLQTQAAEVRCTALEKTSLNHNFETDFC